MAEQDESAITDQWMGCSCPECHVLFRVSIESRGKEVECPTCGELVTIPVVGAPAAPAPPEPAAGTPAASKFRRIEPREERRGEGESDDGPVLIRKKKRRGPPIDSNKEEFEWEQAHSPARRRRRMSGPRFLLTGLASLAVVVGLVTLLNLGGKGDLAKEQEPVKPPVTVPPDIPDPPPEEAKDSEFAKIEMEETMKGIDRAVHQFLAAGTIEELFKVVRGGEAVRERIRSYHEDHELVAAAPHKIAPRGTILKSGGLWSVEVILKDFSQRPIAIEQIEDRYLIDWESWVGYSEMSWTEFMETRSREAKIFRVRLSPSRYYNFDFDQEADWQAFRLKSPDQEHLVYGYVPKDSKLVGELTPLGSTSESMAYILKLRYPEKSSRQDQVLIESVVCSGWVLREDGP